MHLLASLAAMLMALGGQSSADTPCSPRPLPPALDSLAPASDALTMAFSATPSRDHPGRPWVVRLTRKTYSGPASIEILRLRRQQNCNRYAIEKSWRAPFPAEQFDSIARQVLPVVSPGGEAFSPDAVEIATDGTGITLRAATGFWEATRQLHLSGPKGAAMSSIFHALVLKHVSRAEQPTNDWRTPRR